MNCSYCGSSNTKKKGFRTYSDGSQKQTGYCRSCNKRFTVDFLPGESKPSRFDFSRIEEGEIFVITSVQNNTEINEEFFDTLLNYCDRRGARLILSPTLYQKNLYEDGTLDWYVPRKYLIEDKFSLNGLVNVLSSRIISPTADNPLSGLDGLSKGKTLIVPHGQLMMRSLPVQRDSYPVILHTTGTISHPNYKESKAGEKADFNHSYSALVIEFVKDVFHIRVLNCDDNNGFYDIDGYYRGNTFAPIDRVEALITGDEHVYVNCPDVSDATYFSDDSIVNILRPKVIVRHDVLDCFTVSHHHRRDNFLQYSKFINQRNMIERELQSTVEYIIETTPEDTETVIIPSNHHDHLKRWLNECDPKIEPWNAKIYHQLTYLMLEEIENKDDIYVPDPFKLYIENMELENVSFADRNQSFKIKDIELSNHGDIGANGARGSISQFSRFADKMVVAHSHSPGIMKGAYQVGCSTPKELEYTNGASSWMNTHCVIYPNGKRQLLNIIRGQWRK